MPQSPPRPASIRVPAASRRSGADALGGIWAITLTTFIIGALYFGREVLIPLALAALITFLLAPLVSRLERWLGRIGAVIFAMLTILGATAAGTWTLGLQAVDLADQLPAYKENIRSKLQSFQVPRGGILTRLSETVEDLKKDLPGAAKVAQSEAPAKPKAEEGEAAPMPVEVVSTPDTGPFHIARTLAAPILGPLGTGALVLLLATFMLLKREDLSGRLIRLIGQGRISSTTRAMDDAGARIRRYLLMQLVVNVTYGIPLAIGLYFIGVPNAVLWGAIATVLRFIPYIGPWIAAFFPILLSLAVSPSWTTPLLTIGLFVVIELISNNVLEPWLYGSSTGVSSIALIVAAVFWTWMWGAVGLVLATPITVCLVVMGRHIPQLSFLSIVLSEDEALTPAEDCYHRLLRHGGHDETELVDAYLKSHSLGELYDQMLLPVIAAAEEDHRQGVLADDQRREIQQALREIVEELEERYSPAAEGEDEDEEAEGESAAPTGCRVLCLPARAERDELAGAMLVHMLSQQGGQADNVPGRRNLQEITSLLQERETDMVFISVVAPSKALHARNLCRKIRGLIPGRKLVVALWGEHEHEELAASRKLLREAGADEVVVSIAEATACCERFTLQLEEKTLPAPVPADETQRLATLHELGLVNDEPEPVLDRITARLARIFEVPIASITLVERERQYFKAHSGLPADLAASRETPRDLSVCAHVVALNGPLVIHDLQRDARFAGNPLLRQHGLRFYAGVPLRAPNGQPIGAICLMDVKPRRFSQREQRLLMESATDIAGEIERLAEAKV